MLKPRRTNSVSTLRAKHEPTVKIDSPRSSLNGTAKLGSAIGSTRLAAPRSPHVAFGLRLRLSTASVADSLIKGIVLPDFGRESSGTAFASALQHTAPVCRRPEWGIQT